MQKQTANNNQNTQRPFKKQQQMGNFPYQNMFMPPNPMFKKKFGAMNKMMMPQFNPYKYIIVFI